MAFIDPLLKRYSNKYSCIDIYIHGDIGFALPEFYEISKEYDTKYAIRLKPNAILYKYYQEFSQSWKGYTFVVTNTFTRLEAVITFYCNRGTMDTFIKEGKNGFDFNKMNSSFFITNANKLQEMDLAYNLNIRMRDYVLQIQTL